MLYCGYYWIFPKSANHANVGVGWFGKRAAGLSIHRELKRILAKEGLREDALLRKAGGPIPIGRKQNIVQGRTLLVGDAAGLASPLHGGGIDTASISGILAARAVSAGDPGQYERAVEKILAARLSLEQRGLNLWEKLSFDELNGLLAVVFGKRLGRFAHLLRYRSLLPEIAFLRSLASGRLRADW